VVLAGEDAGCSFLFRDNGESTVAADIVEGVDVSVTVFADDKLKAGDLVAQVVPGVQLSTEKDHRLTLIIT
jgi:hypothetical protein